MTVSCEYATATGATSTLPSGRILEQESPKLWFTPGPQIGEWLLGFNNEIGTGAGVHLLLSGSYTSAVAPPVPYSPPATNTWPFVSTAEAQPARVSLIGANTVQVPLT